LFVREMVTQLARRSTTVIRPARVLDGHVATATFRSTCVVRQRLISARRRRERQKAPVYAEHQYAEPTVRSQANSSFHSLLFRPGRGPDKSLGSNDDGAKGAGRRPSFLSPIPFSVRIAFQSNQRMVPPGFSGPQAGTSDISSRLPIWCTLCRFKRRLGESRLRFFSRRREEKKGLRGRGGGGRDSKAVSIHGRVIQLAHYCQGLQGRFAQKLQNSWRSPPKTTRVRNISRPPSSSEGGFGWFLGRREHSLSVKKRAQKLMEFCRVPASSVKCGKSGRKPGPGIRRDVRGSFTFEHFLSLGQAPAQAA